MKHPKLRKELILAVTASAIFIFLKIFRYHLNKFFPGLPIGAVTKISYAVLFLLFVVQIFSIIKRRKKSKGKIKLKFRYYVPSFILMIAILYKFSPIKIDAERLEGKTLFKACYEASGTKAVIRFRTNKKFEISWMAEGNDELFYGTYAQRKDTIFLYYDYKAPEKFGGTILNDGHNLICLDKPYKADEYYVIFTIGLCGEY